MKVKRSIYNLISGVFGQLITIALGIVIPRLFLVNLGSEANGLVSSVTQIFVYFGLLEAGVGLATTQALYKPIAQDDKDEINAILAATDKYYKRTGIIYLVCVLLISCIYPIAIDSSIDKLSIFLVTLFQGLGGAISYFFQGKYRLLLQAEGKGYILTNLTTIVHVAVSITKIVLLISGFDVVVIQGMYFAYNLLQVLFIMLYIRKKYRWINLNVKPNYPAISQKGFVLIHQISGMIFSNTDILILTLFCDLKIVSVYAMYNLLFNMINTFMSTISSSVSFQLGQVYAINKKQFVKIFDVYENYYSVINFAVCTVAYIFILPFITLYTQGINDINYINVILPPLFVAINLMSNAKLPSNQVIVVAGHFDKTKYRSIAEVAINLIVSILCVSKFGLPGVLIGTIVALLYRFNDMIIYSNKAIIKRLPLKTYVRLFADVVVMILVVFISQKAGITYDSYFKLIIGAGVHLFVCLLLFGTVNSLIDFESFKNVINFIRNKLKTKI